MPVECSQYRVIERATLVAFKSLGHYLKRSGLTLALLRISALVTAEQL